MMQIKIFTVTQFSDGDPAEELNGFLRTVKVLDIRKEFVNFESGLFWAICVTYLPNGSDERNQSSIPRKDKVDYKTVLSESEFKKFSMMRKIRKAIAEEDAVPPFAIFTDAELNEIVKLTTVDVSSLLTVKGIGQRKAEKYGERFCIGFSRLLNDEKAGQSEIKDN